MEIEPLELLAHRELTLIDTRPEAERFGDLGFIPGSRWFPEEVLTGDPFQLTDELPQDRGLVLACLTGRRSVELLPVVTALGYGDVRILKGGLLAWSAALPVCQLRAPESGPSRPMSVEALNRQIIACFVAESVENALRQGLDAEAFNPKAVVDEVVAQAFERHQNPRAALYEVIERLSELAWQRGHPIETIAGNVDRLMQMVDDASA